MARVDLNSGDQQVQAAEKSSTSKSANQAVKIVVAVVALGVGGYLIFQSTFSSPLPGQDVSGTAPIETTAATSGASTHGSPVAPVTPSTPPPPASRAARTESDVRPAAPGSRAIGGSPK